METQTSEMTNSRIIAEEQIEIVKKIFQEVFFERLNLKKVSAPLAVIKGTGINDDLNGTERPVEFSIKNLQGQKTEIVQSLAKWKRLRLMELGIDEGCGIFTDMKALRPDEELDPLHSIFVDQWDWEKHIVKEQRTLNYLKSTVRQIYGAIKETQRFLSYQIPFIKDELPEEIKFIHSEDLLKEYPELTPKEREYEVARKYGAIFIIGIGAKLANGKPHDGRAPDYDDWITETGGGYKGLNGDIILWNPTLKCAFEISSMGIRVDKESLVKQVAIHKCEERLKLFFHDLIMKEELPLSIGGGIGQSRLCMFLLQKKHIGEVQVGIWSEEIKQNYLEQGICLL